jgi:cytoskeletal protein RodZ
MNDQYPSRSEKRLKRKKTNRILNTAIVVVIILIIIVAFSIFSGGKDEKTSKNTNNEPKTSQQETAAANKDKQEIKQDKHTEKEKKKKKEEKVVVQQGGGPNVEETIKNPNWEPVATQQSGEHVSSFDTNSLDWKEKLKALSYATGIPENNMTVWFVSGEGPNKAIGTVSPKGRKNDAYRVYIEWVDGKGWKPVQVEKLIHNDKGM